MQKYIENQISEGITLHPLAKEAEGSPWHSARIFKECTRGGTPFDHIRTIRLSCAANRLKYENEKIIDVAFDFVFGSHETFTRAFSKQFGITPKLYEFFWAVEDGPIFQLEPLGIGDTSKLDRLGR